MENKDYVKIDPRMYEYVRKSAVSNLTDAIVELVTNSYDAYMEGKIEGKKDINIEITKEKLIVKDQAIGILINSMKKCFLTVGSYTAYNDDSRGHFSRGAKDISALGDVTFTGIKNGKIAQCKLGYNCRCYILKEDEDVTNEIREYYGIKNNGLHVELKFKNYSIENWTHENFLYYYSLRDIFANDDFNINLSYYRLEEPLLIKYSYPQGNKLAELKYKMPTYGDVEATFELYEVVHEEDFHYDTNMKYSENGILITSDTVVYENTLLNNNIMRNKYSKKFYGRIHCNHIKKLLIDYDKNGSTPLNPIPIIDPSRLTGLNKSHPFTGHLFKVPLKRLEFILSEKFRNKKNEDLNKLSEILDELKDLQFIGDDIFNHLDINFSAEENILSLNPVDLEAYDETKNDDNILQDEEIEPDSESESEDDDDDDDDEDKDEDEEEQFNILKKKNINRVHINFIDEESIAKFTTLYDESGVYINISLRHPGLKIYMDPDKKDKTAINSFEEINKTEVRMILAEILVEAFTKIVSDNELKKLDLKEMNQEEILNTIEETNDKYYKLYSQKVYDILFRDVRVEEEDENVIDV